MYVCLRQLAIFNRVYVSVWRKGILLNFSHYYLQLIAVVIAIIASSSSHPSRSLSGYTGLRPCVGSINQSKFVWAYKGWEV